MQKITQQKTDKLYSLRSPLSRAEAASVSSHYPACNSHPLQHSRKNKDYDLLIIALALHRYREHRVTLVTLWLVPRLPTHRRGTPSILTPRDTGITEGGLLCESAQPYTHGRTQKRKTQKNRGIDGARHLSGPSYIPNKKKPQVRSP
ncbi:hypothetical protein SKAU_G00387740 [Synaphobranchus kaupii]|uniref:Uncharacterized protein n=1 Tax=Synaphobranchus kaupii TaxID=118154 RepID=A0A9Q1IDB2_SYNKA|nr:hypothetical protein SKAU_G00387740 [Synaphobranchus kaupii]